MIEKVLAQKFIEQIMQYTDYNINIMNEKGVIVASRDSKRVGTFHEIAYYIVTGNEDMVITSCEGDYPEVKPGINVVLIIDGKREGVLGITGDPSEIKSVALITKMAIETMMKYEKQQEEILKRQNRKEQFIHFLTHESNFEASGFRNLARQLNYTEDVIRIPILCKLSEVEADHLLDLIKAGGQHSSEDISIVLDKSHILIFKTVTDGMNKLLSDYKYKIADYLSVVLRWLREEGKNAQFYIGSFQNNFTQYYHSYCHCKWLEETVNPEATSAFFYDYAGRYVRSVAPVSELQRIFHVYEKELEEGFKENFIEVGGAMIQYNYNLVLAAKALFMHKNTLSYRYNKIKDTLNINPIVSSSDRFFMESFYYYLIKER